MLSSAIMTEVSESSMWGATEAHNCEGVKRSRRRKSLTESWQRLGLWSARFVQV